MDPLLLTLTAASLVIAAASSTITWKLARDARLRSAARVAALRAASEPERQDIDDIPEAWSFPAAQSQSQAAPLSGVVSDSFLVTARPATPGDRRQRKLAVAAALLLVTLAASGIWMAGGFTSRAAVAAAQPRPAAQPLELISLGHVRRGAALVVSGLVRNPAAGQQMERVSATVSLFDSSGTLVSTAETPLDPLGLAPGRESDFAVVIDAPPAVARYRVSFTAGGSIVPHVDRRSPPAAERASAEAAHQAGGR